MSANRKNTSISFLSVKLFFTGCLLLPSTGSFAQKDSAIILKEVNVSSSKNLFSSGLMRKEFDSTDISGFSDLSLSQLLNEKSAVYLKNYGSGGLSTISLRGGSAYHTAVIWNGFSLASPFNGLTDLSLISNSFFSEVNLQYGGTSYLWGSGAVSGSIHLNNRPAFNSGLKITAGLFAGSFSDYSEQAGVSFGSERIFVSSRFYNHESKNNFSYHNETNDLKEKMQHAEIKQRGLMNEFYLLTGKQSYLNLAFWHSFSNRQVPPSLFQVNHDAEQKDVTTRITAAWNHAGFLETSLRSGIFLEKINYDDDFLTHPSHNRSKSFINEATIGKTIDTQHNLQLEIANTYCTIDSSANFSKADENRFALFLLYRYFLQDKMEISLSSRKEFSTFETSPVTVAGGISYNPIKKLEIRAAASTVYRNPTLNDLFWIPGGNKNLRPETGHSFETGFSIELPELITSRISNTLVINATAFYKNINDWIIWYPSTSFNWIPQNLMAVKSRGLETAFSYRIVNRDFVTGFTIDYFYTASTNEKSLYANDASLNRQLIYVPRHSFNLSCHFGYKNFTLNYYHSYTGIRYTTSDNSSHLKPYQVSTVELRKNFFYSHHRVSVHLRIRNLFDTEFQSVVSRPMPMRSFEGGVSYEFWRGREK